MAQPERNDKPIQFELELDRLGRGLVFLGGIDISRHTSQIEVHAKPGELTRIILHIQNVEIAAAGEAKIEE